MHWRTLHSYARWSAFYDTPQWHVLRKATLRRYGFRCQKCGATNTELHVDHIRPRSRFPKLAMDPDNLQVLCRACNYAKRGRIADYRHGQVVPPQRIGLTRAECVMFVCAVGALLAAVVSQ